VHVNFAKRRLSFFALLCLKLPQNILSRYCFNTDDRSLSNEMVYDIFPSGSFSKTKTCIIIVICRNRAIKKFISLPGSAGTKLVKISLCVFLIILSTYIYEGIVNFNNSYYSLDSDQIVENNSVKILFWTEYYQKNPLTKLPQGKISKNYTYKMIKCPMVSHCLFTTNRSELHESDGIVFHASDLTNE